MMSRKAKIGLGIGAVPVVLFAAVLLRSCVGSITPYAVPIPPADYPARILLFGDSRPGLHLEVWRKDPEKQRLQVLQRIADEDPVFIVNTGDFVADGARKPRWAQFDREHAPIFSKRIPYFPCLGNHEYIGDNDVAMGNYFAHWPLLGGRKWYTIPFLNVLLVCLDSNFDELSEGEIAAQDAWLGETLAGAEGNAEVKAVFLLFHHPPYTNSTVHGDSAGSQEHFVARRTPKVRWVLCGHVHSYERFLKDGVHYVVSGGGGAPITGVDVESPRHEDLFKGPEIRTFNYCLVTIDRTRVAVDVMMLGADGAWTRGDGFEIGLTP